MELKYKIQDNNANYKTRLQNTRHEYKIQDNNAQYKTRMPKNKTRMHKYNTFMKV